ncbi:Dabb family protein [Microcella daejeonensis]|nr:Dabb family protein [Microcella daejeonensis]WAB85285.1 Dabb family protein [Microcella daejeonensis]
MAIQHIVVFRLVHPLDSPAAAAFLTDAREPLTSIPGVQHFAVRRQISVKSDLEHQFSMVFEDDPAYAAYSAHPTHTAFVAERWIPEVAEFQEYDVVDAA